MATVDENIERLIVRHLDGELTAEEELELNRELIRSPEARRLMEDYQSVDSMAGSALKQMIADSSATFDTAKLASLTLPPTRRRRAGRLHILWLVPGAIAAALLALVVPNPWAGPGESGPERMADQGPSTSTPVEYSGGSVPSDLMRTVSHGTSAPTIKRSTGRNVFGVVGDDGNIYWIQVDRIRTLKRSGRRPSGQARNDIM